MPGAHSHGRTILVRCGWQTCNIGDIAHIPGILSLLQRHRPDATPILWPSRLGHGVADLLRSRFPNLRILRDAPNDSNPHPAPGDPSLDEAFQSADLLIHGPSASLASQDLLRFHHTTGRPFGICGVTLGSTIGSVDDVASFSPEVRQALASAAFVFTRESRSLGEIKAAGIPVRRLAFGPDATFACDLRDEPAADRTLASLGLEAGRFLCAIPRLRHSPYWSIYPESNTLQPDAIARREAANSAAAAADFTLLRTIISHWVRSTGLPVLACPEMEYQVALLRPELHDAAPADVRPFVRMLGHYWLTGEATSVYARAAALVSLECHSPLLAWTAGTPAIHLRQPTDTWKSTMYADLGLGDWRHDIETADPAAIASQLTAFLTGRPAASARAASAVATARHALDGMGAAIAAA